MSVPQKHRTYKLPVTEFTERLHEVLMIKCTFVPDVHSPEKKLE
jgi:hypothetical protein